MFCHIRQTQTDGHRQTDARRNRILYKLDLLRALEIAVYVVINARIGLFNSGRLKKHDQKMTDKNRQTFGDCRENGIRSIDWKMAGQNLSFSMQYAIFQSIPRFPLSVIFTSCIFSAPKSVLIIVSRA